MLLRHFEDAEAECARILAEPDIDPGPAAASSALPAYDQCIKASHLFNLLDARGVISVTERDCLSGQAGCHGIRSLRMALRMVSSLRMAATRATWRVGRR